jgi:hypothetical protein
MRLPKKSIGSCLPKAGEEQAHEPAGAVEQVEPECIGRRPRELVDPKIEEHRGGVVKNTGDGLLAEFPSVVAAVVCAVEVQRGMAEANAAVSPDKRIEFRVGINLGGGPRFALWASPLHTEAEPFLRVSGPRIAPTVPPIPAVLEYLGCQQTTVGRMLTIDAIAAIRAEIQTLLTKLKPITDAIISGQADAALLDENNLLQQKVADLDRRRKQLEASV